MTTVLLLGFLIGLQHAMEADHVAAVASLATRSRSVAHTVRQGAVWGLGHSLTLCLFGGAVLLADRLVPERLASALEIAVGVMLVGLGLDVLRRLVRDRIHFHAHRHDAETHFHAHGHPPDVDHDRDPHHHRHPDGFPLRALLVGMMHGMAGSAALVVLVLGSVASPWQGLAYIALFGLGSVAGMAALGAAISVPLRRSARHLTWAHNGLKALVGMLTLAIGAHIIVRGLLGQGLIA
jgi:ABC-type nickel/cobalt efflux system permease component RcnA